jgi:hypothetical protein
LNFESALIWFFSAVAIGSGLLAGVMKERARGFTRARGGIKVDVDNPEPDRALLLPTTVVAVFALVVVVGAAPDQVFL